MKVVLAPARSSADAGAAERWSIRGGDLALDRPRLMGILNITPDSFSDAGELPNPQAALERAAAMVAEGADLLDVGGESTRPGAATVAAGTQIDRVVPVIELLARHLRVPVSVDTRDARVARAALTAGAAIVNDVSGLADPEMAEVVRDSGAGLVIMHMRGTPETMQSRTDYLDVAGEVAAELMGSLERALAGGIQRERIVLDPGIGFAKTAAQNVTLLASLDRIASLGRPVLIGPSRKSFLAQLAGGLPPRERVAATVAACVAALLGGARLFRVHDVAPVRQALAVAEAVRRARSADR